MTSDGRASFGYKHWALHTSALEYAGDTCSHMWCQFGSFDKNTWTIVNNSTVHIHIFTETSLSWTPLCISNNCAHFELNTEATIHLGFDVHLNLWKYCTPSRPRNCVSAHCITHVVTFPRHILSSVLSRFYIVGEFLLVTSWCVAFCGF